MESDHTEVGQGGLALLRSPLPAGCGVPVYGALDSGIMRQPPQVSLSLQNLGSLALSHRDGSLDDHTRL